MPEYHVYEPRPGGDSFIGTVTADSKREARDKAHDQFGGPINIVRDHTEDPTVSIDRTLLATLADQANGLADDQPPGEVDTAVRAAYAALGHDGDVLPDTGLSDPEREAVYDAASRISDMSDDEEILGAVDEILSVVGVPDRIVDE